MRFRLDLEIKGENRKLPINYQYELSSFFYQISQKGNNGFISWLKANDFNLYGKKFKLFTFSNFIIPQYRIDSDRIIINCNNIIWYISILPEVSTEDFIKEILTNRQFSIGDRKSSVKFIVKNIDVVLPPDFCEIMTFRTISSINISRKNDQGKVDYMNPADDYSKQAILRNTLNKYRAFYGKEYHTEMDKIDFDFKVLSDPKAKLILIKAGTSNETRIRGYHCKMQVKSPVELMKIIYECGIGEKGSLGFGCLEVIA